MKSIPALIAFLVVYYTVWFLSVPFILFRSFVSAMSGDDDN
jgi:hypothetical protein